MVLEYLIQNEMKGKKKKMQVTSACFRFSRHILVFALRKTSTTRLFKFLDHREIRYITNAILVFEFAMQRYPIDLPRDGYHNEMCIKCECLLFDGILEYVLCIIANVAKYN